MSKRPNNGILKLWRQKWRLLLFFFQKHRKDRGKKIRKKTLKKSCWTSRLRFASSIVILSKRRSETPVTITKRAKWQFPLLLRNGWTPKRRPLCKGQLCRCHHLDTYYVRTYSGKPINPIQNLFKRLWNMNYRLRLYISRMWPMNGISISCNSYLLAYPIIHT